MPTRLRGAGKDRLQAFRRPQASRKDRGIQRRHPWQTVSIVQIVDRFISLRRRWRERRCPAFGVATSFRRRLPDRLLNRRRHPPSHPRQRCRARVPHRFGMTPWELAQCRRVQPLQARRLPPRQHSRPRPGAAPARGGCERGPLPGAGRWRAGRECRRRSVPWRLMPQERTIRWRVPSTRGVDRPLRRARLLAAERDRHALITEQLIAAEVDRAVDHFENTGSEPSC